MTRNTTANVNDSVSQRKRSANQPRANVASQNIQQSQQNSKKGNKQQSQQNTQNQNQNQNQGAAKLASGAATNNAATTSVPATSLPATPLAPTVTQPDESYVPLAGFNGDDIDKLLKNGFEEKALIYKPEQPAAQQKTTPWGQKPGSMSNGKDFWLELRKQVSSLQKGESANKGG